MQNYIYIETYGCTANQNNSEIIAGKLTQQGHKITNNIDIADIIILNTCIVKGKTENKIKRRIQDLTSAYPNKQMLITGCMPETNKLQIRQLNPNVNFLTLDKNEKLLVPKIPKNKLISITQISEGCYGNCTYCKTRLAKGKLFSYNQDEIVKSIENDLKAGAKEVWITSQDNANYNMDKGKQKLPELLNKILLLNHRFKLRLGMMDPNNVLPILEELIEIYKNKKIYKFLHIPIQSASNKVLKDMNRLYTIQQAEEIINKFRKQIPNIVISTDIIVGYPTEQESDHKQNMNFIKKHKPSIFNLSKMSIHKKTLAEKLKELPTPLIHKRTTELMSIHRQTALENKQKFLNKEIKVFVNKKLPDNLYETRDENYNIVLINSKNKSILGKNINVRINQIGVHHMIGKII